MVWPLLALMGAAPQRWAKAAWENSRWELSVGVGAGGGEELGGGVGADAEPGEGAGCGLGGEGVEFGVGVGDFGGEVVDAAGQAA